MATSPATTTDTGFNSAYQAFLSAAALRPVARQQLGTSEEVEPIVDVLFGRLIESQSSSLSEAVAKIEVILAEYGDGNAIPSYMVEALLADLRRLEH